eukprot:4160250-Pleurochrysis_carterae.AAC.1
MASGGCHAQVTPAPPPMRLCSSAADGPFQQTIFYRARYFLGTQFLMFICGAQIPSLPTRSSMNVQSGNTNRPPSDPDNCFSDAEARCCH